MKFPNREFVTIISMIDRKQNVHLRSIRGLNNNAPLSQPRVPKKKVKMGRIKLKSLKNYLTCVESRTQMYNHLCKREVQHQLEAVLEGKALAGLDASNDSSFGACSNSHVDPQQKFLSQTGSKQFWCLKLSWNLRASPYAAQIGQDQVMCRFASKSHHGTLYTIGL